MAPLVLVFAAFIWDLRAYVSHRTDLAREAYVLAEVISDLAERDDAMTFVLERNSTAPTLLDAFVERLARRGAGSLDIAIVVRDDEDRAGNPCAVTPPPSPCPPLVAQRWPWPNPATDPDRLWSGPGGGAAGGDCAPAAWDIPVRAAFLSSLPDEGDQFGSDRLMLPNENASSAVEDQWFSRTIPSQQWWVVVDVCLHPGPGTFTGPLIAAGMNALDFGSFVTRVRAAWASIHDFCQPGDSPEWRDPRNVTPCGP